VSGQVSQLLVRWSEGDESALAELAAECEPDGSIVDAVIGEAASTVVEEPFKGRTLGHFRVLRQLGHGAMGEVYLAQDVKLGRNVALKLRWVARPTQRGYGDAVV